MCHVRLTTSVCTDFGKPAGRKGLLDSCYSSPPACLPLFPLSSSDLWPSSWGGLALVGQLHPAPLPSFGFPQQRSSFSFCLRHFPSPLSGVLICSGLHPNLFPLRCCGTFAEMGHLRNKSCAQSQGSLQEITTAC